MAEPPAFNTKSAAPQVRSCAPLERPYTLLFWLLATPDHYSFLGNVATTTASLLDYYSFLGNVATTTASLLDYYTSFQIRPDSSPATTTASQLLLYQHLPRSISYCYLRLQLVLSTFTTSALPKCPNNNEQRHLKRSKRLPPWTVRSVSCWNSPSFPWAWSIPLCGWSESPISRIIPAVFCRHPSRKSTKSGQRVAC